jgi:hypothetical protein
MKTLLCAAVGTASHQRVLCMETLLCAAVGTASHQHVLCAVILGLGKKITNFCENCLHIISW